MKNNSFWNRVSIGGPDECWLWRGAKDGFGYGATKRNGVKIRVHRYSWMLANGPIPVGMQINHSCDVPACVNPAHLKLGTQLENMREKVERNRQASGLRNGSHTKPERRPRGERVGGAKLKEEDVIFIRNRLKCGGEGAAIAKKFGVTNANITSIRKGKTWAHLTGGAHGL